MQGEGLLILAKQSPSLNTKCTCLLLDNVANRFLQISHQANLYFWLHKHNFHDKQLLEVLLVLVICLKY